MDTHIHTDMYVIGLWVFFSKNRVPTYLVEIRHLPHPIPTPSTSSLVLKFPAPSTAAGSGVEPTPPGKIPKIRPSSAPSDTPPSSCSSLRPVLAFVLFLWMAPHRQVQCLGNVRRECPLPPPQCLAHSGQQQGGGQEEQKRNGRGGFSTGSTQSSGTLKSYSLSTQHPNLVCTHLLSQFPPFPQVSPPEKMTLKSWAPLWTHPHPHRDCWKVESPVIGIFKIPSSVSCTLVPETHCPFILPPAQGRRAKTTKPRWAASPSGPLG